MVLKKQRKKKVTIEQSKSKTAFKLTQKQLNQGYGLERQTFNLSAADENTDDDEDLMYWRL